MEPVGDSSEQKIDPDSSVCQSSPPPLAPIPNQQTVAQPVAQQPLAPAPQQQQPVVTQPQAPPQQAYPDQQQQQYAAYRQQQMYYAQQQQQYLMQQRQAAYYQQQMRQQAQQQAAMRFYQQIGQQYGYQTMVQAMNTNLFLQHQQQQHAQQQSRYAQPPQTQPPGRVMLSAEEQPLLSGGADAAAKPKPQQSRAPRKRKRGREEVESEDDDDLFTRNATVSIEVSDAEIEETAGLDKDGYDRATFVNQQEVLPDMDLDFEEWLAFSKKLWRRQKKYKDVFAAEDARKSCLDDSISPSNDSPVSSPRKSIIFRSAFMNGLE